MHPLARRAATELMDTLQSHYAASWRLHEPGNGKMFGVLIVEAPDGTTGYLRGFSGMIDGRWDIEGWAPAAFDRHARDVVWIPGEAEMLNFARERATLLASLNDQSDSADTHQVTAAVRTLDITRAARSRVLMAAIQDSYHFANAHGETRSLRTIFAPAEPRRRRGGLRSAEIARAGISTRIATLGAGGVLVGRVRTNG